MSKSSSRRFSSVAHIDRLEERHAQLKAEVAQLDKRMHLSTPEEVRLQQLKREKLRMKDAIESLRGG
jgi:hypothetical protein